MPAWSPDGALASSERHDWNTPANVLRLLHAGWPDGVSLDPCSNATSIVEAALTYDVNDNGLTKDWSDGLPAQGLIYINPPYGKALDEWATTIALKHQAMAEAGIMHAIFTLVPARTDTAWFRTLLRNAEGVIFLAGRLRFLGAEASAPFPSALVVHQHGCIKKVQKVAAAARQLEALVFNA